MEEAMIVGKLILDIDKRHTQAMVLPADSVPLSAVLDGINLAVYFTHKRPLGSCAADTHFFKVVPANEEFIFDNCTFVGTVMYRHTSYHVFYRGPFGAGR